MTYAIFEDFFPEVEKKLTRIAKKCVKHGNEFVYNVTGEEVREFENKETGKVDYYKFILVEVEGTARIDDWECIAVLEIHSTGNVIRRINTDIEMPERFKISENVCEHCNSHRDNRKNLYVIHNIKTDEWKQVGGNCLMLYTGGLSMEYVVAFLDGITQLEESDGVVSFGGKPYYKVQDVLALAVEVIGKTGYFNSDSALPTRRIVANFLFEKDIHNAIIESNKDFDSRRMAVRFSKSDFLKPNTNATVEEIINYYTNVEDDSEFVHNIKIMLKDGYITSKNLGYLCYLPHGYAKHIEREIERAKRLEEKHEHFGEVGKRYKDMKIMTIGMLTSWLTDYGVTYIYKIVLESGEILVWKTTNEIFDDNDDEEFDKITFSVKAHTEYKGQKQTEVTRCKITCKKANKEN
jgi:hypothetical protein